MSTWLVTGGSGFLGRHVLDVLDTSAPLGADILAIGRRRPEGWPASAFVRADLDDPSGLARTCESLAPEVVIHTAGLTPPADPLRLYRANTRATVHLLDALRASGRPTRVVLAGSAAELGPVAAEELPVGEDHPCRPADPYALSKWFAGYAGRTAPAPLEVVVARIFNPIGPGLPSTQALGRFAARLSEPGPDPLRLVVGDLDVLRDFIDVRDVAAALLALALRGRAGLVYHVGTGQSRRVGEGLDHLIRLSGRQVAISVEPGLHGRRGPTDSRADIRRIVLHTGWRPRVSWEQSLADLWAERAGAAARACYAKGA
jgi:GDP-4-dehydro-6-deoxy-D-mannose reductase